jgi:hypothetical protein
MCLNETYIKVHTGKNLPDEFSLQNILKNGDLSSLLLNCAFEYASSNVEDNRVGLKLNETHQLLVYADDVNLCGGNVNTINKSQKL